MYESHSLSLSLSLLHNVHVFAHLCVCLYICIMSQIALDSQNLQSTLCAEPFDCSIHVSSSMNRVLYVLKSSLFFCFIFFSFLFLPHLACKQRSATNQFILLYLIHSLSISLDSATSIYTLTFAICGDIEYFSLIHSLTATDIYSNI